MEKRELIRRLKDLPRYQYIILSGGSLVMRGLRDETRDIDICVSEMLAKELGLDKKKPNENGFYKLPNDFDVMIGMNRINCEIVDGYFCQKLEDILKYKRERRLPKDLKDIEIIEEYFAQQGRS